MDFYKKENKKIDKVPDWKRAPEIYKKPEFLAGNNSIVVSAECILNDCYQNYFKNMTKQKLLCMLYFLQAYSLVKNEQRFFNEPIEVRNDTLYNLMIEDVYGNCKDSEIWVNPKGTYSNILAKEGQGRISNAEQFILPDELEEIHYIAGCLYMRSEFQLMSMIKKQTPYKVAKESKWKIIDCAELWQFFV